MNMKAVIIEDEPLAAERLESLLKDVDPSLDVVARLDSVSSAVSWLRENRPDLIFLDIQLSDGLSFSIFESVRVESPIIFTTAYDQYAIRAFKVNSVDYLLKPIRKEELRGSLEKLKGLRHSLRPDIDELVSVMRTRQVEYKKRFLIQFGERIRKVQTEEVAFFYALEKAVFLTTVQNHTYPVDCSLDALESMLDPEKFFRINRKMLISFDAIRTMIPYSRSRIKIELHPGEPNGVEALVSVERAAAFKKWMDK